ncbi:hypothetical protein BH11VER1_BH11VER1_02030 [soil metagenome]
MPFLTKLDSNAVIKGSRDPLGVQALWTDFGRRIVGNLTTVSTSLRDFTATILGYTFVENLGDEASEVELFLRWEQWAAYCRVHRFSNMPVRGIERVREQLAQSKRVTISATREHQILSNQKTYGLWGLYSMPSRASGLLEEKKARVTKESREFIEREYWLRVKPVGEKLRLKRFSLELDGSHKRLATAVADVLAPPSVKPLSGAERSFYVDHLLHRTSTQESAVATMPPELKNTFVLTPTLLTSWAERASKRDSSLATKLDNVRIMESLLAPGARLFSFLLGQGKQTVNSVANNIYETWGKSFEKLNVDRIKELREDIHKAAGDRANSDLQWLELAQAFSASDYREAIRIACEINASVMRHRGGGPWLAIENNKLRVHANEAPRPLPDAVELNSLWEHSYFLDSLAIMTASLQP